MPTCLGPYFNSRTYLSHVGLVYPQEQEFCSVVEQRSASMGRRVIGVSRSVYALPCLNLAGVHASKRDIGVGVGMVRPESRADVPQLASLGVGQHRLGGRHRAGRRGLPAAIALHQLRILLLEVLLVQGRAVLVWRRRRVALHVSRFPAERVREGRLSLHVHEGRRRDGGALLAGVVLGAHGSAV